MRVPQDAVFIIYNLPFWRFPRSSVIIIFNLLFLNCCHVNKGKVSEHTYTHSHVYSTTQRRFAWMCSPILLVMQMYAIKLMLSYLYIQIWNFLSSFLFIFIHFTVNNNEQSTVNTFKNFLDKNFIIIHFKIEMEFN